MTSRCPSAARERRVSAAGGGEAGQSQRPGRRHPGASRRRSRCRQQPVSSSHRDLFPSFKSLLKQNASRHAEWRRRRPARRRSWCCGRTASWWRWWTWSPDAWKSPPSTSTSTTAAQRRRKVRRRGGRDQRGSAVLWNNSSILLKEKGTTSNGRCRRSERFTSGGTTCGARRWRSSSSIRPTISSTLKKR